MIQFTYHVYNSSLKELQSIGEEFFYSLKLCLPRFFNFSHFLFILAGLQLCYDGVCAASSTYCQKCKSQKLQLALKLAVSCQLQS